jgi:hypothetical protein
VAQVAGAEEFFAVQFEERIPGGFGAIPVAKEHLRAIGDDFALLADRYFLERFGVDDARITAPNSKHLLTKLPRSTATPSRYVAYFVYLFMLT